MATASEWIAGARPRTLAAAVAPVVVGTGVAQVEDAAIGVRAILALLVAVALQVGVNYANDYSDGRRGTDDDRVGPLRLVGGRHAPAGAVLAAALLAFGVGAVAGLVLVALSQAWWLLAVGAAAIASAWFYTGGSHPYGYAGWGEVFVFVFFGLVAVVGTAYTQTGTLTWLAVAAAVPVGAWACAILMVNNIRDIEGDAAVGKRTLAVRLGERRSVLLYRATVATGFAFVILAASWSTWALLGLLALPLAAAPVRLVGSGATGRDLIPALAGTSQVLLVGGVLLGVGLALG